MSEQFKIQPKHRSLADRIKAVVSPVGKDNTLADNDIFRKIATEDGRNVDQMIDDDKYRADFAAGNFLASGELAEAHMKANADVRTVSGVFEIGRNSMEVSFERERTVPHRVLDKDTGNFIVQGEKKLYMDATIKVKMRGVRNSAGDIKNIRDFLHDTGSKAFAN